MAQEHPTLKFKGEALWAKLVEPDFKYNQKYGDFSIRLRVPEEEAEKYFEVLDPLIEEAKRDAMKRITKQRLKETLEVIEPWKEELDDDTGVFTGFYLFSFKQSACIYSKKHQKEYPQHIAIYYGQQPSPKLEVGNGSTVTVAFDTRPYYNEKDNAVGVSLKLKGVLVHKLVEFQGTNLFGDEDFGEEDEDILDAPEKTPEPAPAPKPRRSAHKPEPQEEPEDEVKPQEAPEETPRGRSERVRRPATTSVVDKDELPF